MSRLDDRRRAFQAETETLLQGGEPDPRDATHPLTFGERLRVNPVVHEAWSVLAYAVGMRARLRCPHCTAVGTFKMHGAWVDWLMSSRKDRKVFFWMRRWGCKWCGYWLTKDGRTQAYPSKSAGSWAFPGHDPQRDPTPAEALVAQLGRTWPWYG